MARFDQGRNQQQLDNPQPGDFWSEHFVLYLVVLQVLPNGNRVVAKKDYAFKEHQRPDLANAFEITKTEHSRMVKYSGHDAFMADVITGCGDNYGWLHTWAFEYHGNYKTLAARKKEER